MGLFSMNWFALLLAVLSNVIANVAFKKAMEKEIGPDTRQVVLQYCFEPWMWTGGFFAALLLLCYLYALKSIPLNIAYPVVTGLAMLGVAVSGALLFQESLSLQRVFATLMILAGVLMLRLSA
jgi:multidrug transporter EmrE-like cation transporter